MLTLLLAALAHAGTVVIDAEVPVEVALESRPVAQVFSASSIHLPAEPGVRKVTIIVGGRATHLRVDVPKEGSAHVVVGRTGITTRTEKAEDAAENAPVDIRVVGSESLRLTLDGTRFQLDPGGSQGMELTRGVHTLELRSYDGLAIYAVGDLHVAGTGPVVVQLSAGRSPEVIGKTGSWRPSSR